MEWKRYEDFFYSHSNLYFDLGVSTEYEVEVRRRVGIFAYWRSTRFFVMEVLGHVQLKVGRVGGKDAVGKPLSPRRLQGGRRPRHSHCAVDRCNLGL